MPSIIGNLKIWDINNRDILPPSTIYNVILGGNTNPTGFKFLCIGDSKFSGVLNSDNVNLTSNGTYKINDIIIPQSVLDNSGLKLTNGVLSLDFLDTVSQSVLQSTDLFLLQNSNGISKKITSSQLKQNIDTTYTEGNNIEISSNNEITTESDLTDINSITSGIGENLTFDAGESITESIIFKINNNIRATLSHNSLNLTANNKYKINDLQIDSNDILYVNSGTELLKTKIDTKQNILTFGKLYNNVPFFEENMTTNDIIMMGSTNLMGITYSQLKGLLSLNLVDNTSDLNKPVSNATTTQLNTKQTILFFGKISGFSLKLQETVVTNDVLLMGTSNVIGKTYSELKTLLSLNNVENISVTNLAGNNIFFSGNKLNLNTDLTNMDSITASSDLDLTANDNIVLLSNNDGTNSGDFIFRTNRGGGLLEIMRLNGATANLGIDTSPHATYKLNVSGDINIPSGSNYKIGGTNITDTTYNNGTNITIDGSNNINLNTTLSNILEVVGSGDLSIKAQDDVVYMAGFDGGTVGGKNHIFKTNNGTSIVTLMTLNKDKNITGLNSITAGQGYFTTMNTTNSNMTGNLDVTGTVISDNSFKLNTHKVLFNVGTDEGTNPYLNARVLQNNSSLYNDGMYINYQSTGSSRCRFYAGTSTVPRLQIDPNGNVGIGTTSPDEKLDINGNLVLGMICIKANKDTAFAVAQGTNPNHGNGTLSMGMGSGNVANHIYFASRNVYGSLIYGTLYLPTSGSDDRRKHNEKPITNALNSIMKLQCETYDKTFIFKDTDWSGNLDDVEHSKEAGLIAQDVYKIDEFEDYVIVGDEKTSWDINYNSIFTYNIRATQELKLENDELKNEIVELKLQMKTIYEKLNLNF